MRKLLPLIVATLLIIVFGLLSCSTNKNGCGNNWKQPKQKVYRGFLSLDEPRNIQAKVIEVIEKGKGYVFVKCLSMDGDCIFVKFYSRRNARIVDCGSWLTIWGNYNDEKDTWVTTKIKLNL